MLLRWTRLHDLPVLGQEALFSRRSRMFYIRAKHSLEIEVARKIAADADVPFQLLDVSLISQLDPNCSLTNTGISMDQENRQTATRTPSFRDVTWYS